MIMQKKCNLIRLLYIYGFNQKLFITGSKGLYANYLGY